MQYRGVCGAPIVYRSAIRASANGCAHFSHAQPLSSTEADLQLLDLLKALPRVKRWFESSVRPRAASRESTCLVVCLTLRFHGDLLRFQAEDVLRRAGEVYDGLAMKTDGIEAALQRVTGNLQTTLATAKAAIAAKAVSRSSLLT